jgi:hypothetical protein
MGLLAEIGRGDTGELVWIVGLLLVLGCLVAAAVAAWRSLWVAAACLVVVALVAGFLLL